MLQTSGSDLQHLTPKTRFQKVHTFTRCVSSKLSVEKISADYFQRHWLEKNELRSQREVCSQPSRPTGGLHHQQRDTGWDARSSTLTGSRGR